MSRPQAHSGGPATLEGSGYRVRAGTGSLDFRFAGGSAILRARFGARVRDFRGRVQEIWAGPGTSAAVREPGLVLAESASRAGIRLALEVEAAPEGPLLRLSLENRSPRTVRLDSLFPIAVFPRGAGHGEGGAGGTVEVGGLPLGPIERSGFALAPLRYFRLGFTNLVPALAFGAGDREAAAYVRPALAPLLPRFARYLLHNGESPPSRVKGRFTSEGLGVLGAPSGAVLVAGFLRQREQFGQIVADLRSGLFLARALGDGAELEPGAEVRSEPLLLAAAARPSDGFERYCAAATRLIRPRVRPLTYWCSWYTGACDLVEEPLVLANLDALRGLGRPVEFVLLDDGYEKALGDWLETNERFPHGLRWLADRVREAGMKPGIWLAPFAPSPRSRVFREHPDWMVRGPSGAPLKAGALLGRSGPRLHYALDLTNDGALAWLEDTLRRLGSLGFELFKIDFLPVGAIPGSRRDRRATRAQAYARGMEALRRGAGERPLLGAIAPFLANLGYVDAQRVGTDVALGAARWTTFAGRLLDTHCVPGVRNSLVNPLSLAFLDGRFFASDADCLVSGLPRPLERSVALANLFASSVTGLGYDLARETPDLSFIREFRAIERTGAECARPFDRGIPATELVVHTRKAGCPGRIRARFDWRTGAADVAPLEAAPEKGAAR